MKITEEENSFQKIAEDLNLSVEKIQYYWGNWMTKPKIDPKNQYAIQGDFSSQSQPHLYEIPQIDGQMQAKLVPPRKVLFYWDSSDLPKQLFQHYFNMNFDDLVHFIRIYDVTQIQFNGRNAHHFYDISIPYSQGYWFVKGLFSNRSYLAEIGVKLAAGEFFPLLRSNPITMPKLESLTNNDIYQDVCHLYQHEEQQPKWREYVSTYSYYKDNENGGENQ